MNGRRIQVFHAEAFGHLVHDRRVLVRCDIPVKRYQETQTGSFGLVLVRRINCPGISRVNRQIRDEVLRCMVEVEGEK